ncbi:MAG: TolC family protein [Bacteroidales bacterium]|jgi:outer membrane protein TolC
MKKYAVAILMLTGFYTFASGQERNLGFYLNKGLTGSPLIKDYANQLNSVAYDSALVRAVKKPQIDARSTLQYIPVYGQFGYDEIVTDHGNYQGMVGVSQDIFRGKEIENKIDAINIQRRSLSNATKITSNELARMITDQYLSSVSAFSDLSFNRSFLLLLKNENEIVKQLAAKGIYKQTDYLSLLVESQTQEILVRKLKSEYESSLRQLNIICGINDTSSYELLLPNINFKGEPDITKSPGYLQYGIDSLRIMNERSAIDIRYRPKVSWFADAGFLSHDLTVFYSHFGYSAGMSLSIPIYDGNQRSIEKQKLQIEENTRGNYRDNFMIRYNQQILQLTQELKSEREITFDLEKQLSTSDDLLRALKAELESGLIQMTEYLSAVKNYRIINKALSDNRIRILQIINELNFIINQ